MAIQAIPAATRAEEDVRETAELGALLAGAGLALELTLELGALEIEALEAEAETPEDRILETADDEAADADGSEVEAPDTAMEAEAAVEEFVGAVTLLDTTSAATA